VEFRRGLRATRNCGGKRAIRSGLSYRVRQEALSTAPLDFDDRDRFESHHYAFKVSEEDFDAIFGRVQAEDIPYGSGPYSLEDRKINRRGGGRGVYFRDPNGHVLELLTAG
jgi:catechol 2,3-dioxygenase-like lactoylglutathione lyase family enzyme